MAGYLHDPAGFARDCIIWPRGRTLAGYQGAVLADLADNHRVAVRSMRGAGKSTIASLSVLWFALTREAAGIEWKVITTAGSWGQLTHYLWPEIHKWAARIDWTRVRDGRPLARHELQHLTLRLAHGRAISAASANSALIEGAHADHLLIVFDESKSIPAATFDSAEGALSTGVCYALALSTPGAPAGRFYEFFHRRGEFSEWSARHITLPEVVEATPGDGLARWVEARKRQWGPDSALYCNHVLGEFKASEEDAVIPLAWAEAAIERWKAWDGAGRPTPAGRPLVGVDVARYGADSTCMASRRGHVVTDITRWSGADTMTTAERARLACPPDGLTIVDTIGVGAGVADRLRQIGVPVSGFVASARAVWPDGRPITDRSAGYRFSNLRAAGWWLLREMLDPTGAAGCACPRGNPDDHNCWRCTGLLCLPDDPHVLGDLTSARWSIRGNAIIAINGKDEIRAQLGRSPDTGDAIMMACWPPSSVPTTATLPSRNAGLDAVSVAALEDAAAWDSPGFDGGIP